jgi:hypothetical protein
MRVEFFCTRWGAEEIDWDTFLRQVKEAGYSGIEWFPNGENSDPAMVVELLMKYNLKYSIVMTVTGKFAGFQQYLNDLQFQLSSLAETGKGILQPLFISAQVGREFFNIDQINQCLECCRQISKDSGIPVYQETHRNKWSYAVHILPPVLEINPDVSLTLDVSHWFCVSESYLEDQQEALDLAISRARHVHARIGHTQASQVADPAWSEYQDALEAHLKVWDQWISNKKKEGIEVCSITPEFGPPPYLTILNKNINVQQQQWKLNLWMKNLLNRRYNS